MLQEGLGGRGQPIGPLDVVLELHLVFRGLGLASQAAQGVAQRPERRCERVLDDVGLEDVPVRRHAPRPPFSHRGEEPSGGVPHHLDPLFGFLRRVGAQEPLLPTRRVQEVQEPGHLPVPHLQPQVVGDHLLQAMGLVQDDGLVGGEEAPAILAEGDVFEEDVVVGDEEVGAGHPPTGPPKEAAVPPSARAAQAVVRLAVDQGPDVGVRLLLEIAQAAVFGPVGPLLEVRVRAVPRRW